MNHLDQITLAIIAREPMPGQVKTRLTPELSAEQAAGVYEIFLRHLCRRIGGMGWGQIMICHDPPDSADRLRRMLGDEMPIEFRAQSGDDLGARLSHAAKEPRKCPDILFLGVDSPDVPGELLIEAAALLQSHEVVIGPTDDGGYWTVAIRRHVDPVRLFANIAWSSGRERDQTVAAAARLGYKVGFARPWDDIDRPADLRRLIRRLRASSAADDKRLLDGLTSILPPAGGMESKQS